VVSQFPLGHLRYAMIHKITIVPIIGTNESSDNHGDRPVRRKIRHDGTIVTVISTTQKSTEITSNTRRHTDSNQNLRRVSKLGHSQIQLRPLGVKTGQYPNGGRNIPWTFVFLKKVFEPLQRAHLQTMYIPLGYT